MSKTVIEESPRMAEYFKKIDEGVHLAHDIANKAKKKGFDPENYVDVPLAKDMAEKVEGLISSVAPQLKGVGLNKRIKELEEEYYPLAWEVALLIAEEVAKEKFCKFEDKREAIEVGIRTGFAYHTLGTVSAPLEGLTRVQIKKRLDGKEYLALFYSGPIRGAGGTASSVSVLIADYVRLKMGLDKFDPQELEIKRYVTEVQNYHEWVTNLQYFPSEPELQFMVTHLPVELNGDPTEKREVSNYKDLPRVETNLIRGGICLVVAEGLCQKSPKLWKQLNKWQEKLGMDWNFLKEFLSIQKQMKAKKTVTSSKEDEEKILPNFTYIKDIVAGRPILSHPMAKGGFRLRYGRSRVSGFVCAGLHPATMYLLNSFIAIGTQLKVERPGKAASVSCNDNIEGPIVKLKNGDILRINSLDKAKELQNEVHKILFLGDILINHGDFINFNHPLIPAGYCDEWWVLELEQKVIDLFGHFSLDKLSEIAGIALKKLNRILKNPINNNISIYESKVLSDSLNIPLHPKFTYHYTDLDKEDFYYFLDSLAKSKIQYSKGELQKIICENKLKLKEILEKIGLPHRLIIDKIVIEKVESLALFFTLGIKTITDLEKKINLVKNLDEPILGLINYLSNYKIRDKSGSYIGARMGRPEKVKMRKLTGSPHMLFPVAEEGGRLRSLQSALDVGKITADFALFKCDKCGKKSYYPKCSVCEKEIKLQKYCPGCASYITTETCPKHEKVFTYKNQPININEHFREVLKKLKISNYPDLIKGVRGTSNKDHIPEYLGKGILRAKHGVYVNKDGTTRHDMSELPLTHFKPFEIRTSVEKLIEIGYTHDIYGNPLKDSTQILELYPQDVILPSSKMATDENADDVLYNVANFVDEELTRIYDAKPYYNLKDKNDLVGHYIIGLAPHISAGMVGRIIGFAEVQGFLCHPLFHCSMRRDCDGDEACAILLMDAFLNFSRNYLPDRRGGRTMDAPLVLTSKLIPSEVDDQSHSIDVGWKYSLDFYKAAQNYKNTWEVKMDLIGDRLHTPLQYEGHGFTHDVTNFNEGVLVSAYKTLPSMEEKLKGQMNIAEKVRATDEADVARLVIEKHFIKDIKGNLRKFSMQQFRCVHCNKKYRRPPLIGKCTQCQGKIIFTISEGSIVKYLNPSISIAEKYAISVYLKQTLTLLKQRIEEVFGKEKEVQQGLGKWFAKAKT